MRWHFNKVGWPQASTVLPGACESDADKDKLIDTLQDWKTDHYQALITSGAVDTRPGVLRLMDEARAAGLKVAVCSAATKAAAVTTVSSLLGEARWKALDLFLAGNDVPKLKPDPLIYQTAAQRLGLKPDECLVIEDSTVGLRAATAAGMRCVITYTRTGVAEPFAEALCVVSDLEKGGVTVEKLEKLLASGKRSDDRKAPAGALR
jgi:HAD superfamily hydrolase (TIGR01509 family)